MRKLRTILAGVMLAALMAAPVSAATTSSSTTATAEVLATISMAGVPATYDFGAAIAGQTVTGPEFTVTVTSSETAFTLSGASTNFTSGANTIDANRLTFTVAGVATAYPGPAGVPVQLATVSPRTISMSLALPSTAKGGVYAGTITFTASN